ncbi:MAG: PAS domain-containing protein [Alphaproteobacteria bacterium]|nr:PAS domain-containing protein [Alphaproteobacteria bacterium]
MSDTSAGTETAGRRIMWRMVFTGLAIAIAAAAGVFSVFQFTENERERELKRWQLRLGIVADSRLADIEGWMATQFRELTDVAENESVQLYVSILDEAGGAGDQAEATYLRNLVTVVAERAGFRPDVAAANVRANVERAGTAGVALLDKNGDAIAGSPAMPAITGTLAAFIQGAPKGKRAVSDIFAGPSGAPAIAFLVPVFGVQEDQSANSQIGAVVGVKEVTRELYPLLKQPGSVDETAEAVLVRHMGASVEYLSPLADGTAPLKLRLASDTPLLAAQYALRTPGGFARRKDYRDADVLVTAREISGVPWALLYKVDVAEALAESESRLKQLVIAFLMIIGFVMIGMAALWYYGTSRRATEAATRFEQLAERFENQRDFMHLVTNSQPNSIAIYDAQGCYRWFNSVAVELSGIDKESLYGKPVASVIGPVEAKRIIRWIESCLEHWEPESHTHTLTRTIGGVPEERVYSSDLIPLPATEDEAVGVLFVSQDITDSVNERMRRERIMRQLVSTLVSVVDRRDPFSANHSVRVGMVSRAIASEMELEPELGEAAEIAGNLMNLGKISVPEQVLTKAEALSETEIQLIRDSILTSADLVSDIEFDGPIAETIRQLQENFDGSGMPGGLAGDEILLTARVVSVANAFVAMVSARAYRPGMKFDRAIDILLEESGKAFDRRAVSALVNYLENRGGREAWASFGAPSSGAAA